MSARSKHNDSMSMDDYSDIVIADQSSKFRTSASGIDVRSGYHQKPSRRRGRNNLHLPQTRQHRGFDPATASVSSRSTMEEDMVRLYPERFENEYRSPQQKHVPREVPILESLVKKPKPANNTKQLQSEKSRKHKKSEVAPGNGKSASRATRRKTPKAKSPAKPQTSQKPQKSKNSGMSKLKKLNCFASSNKPQCDDQEGRRQQALIARQHYGRVVPKIDSRDFHCLDEDNYGEGNSLAAGMSVITVGSKDCYKDTARSISSRTTARHRNDKPKPIVPRRSRSNARDILEDLREEEIELNTAYSNEEQCAGSFINLSVSDIEDQLEKREATPLSTLERRHSEAQHHHQKQAMQAQLQAEAHANAMRNSPIQAQGENQRQEQRISATTSVVQGVVTPPRGAGSKSLTAKSSSSKPHRRDGESYEEPSITYTYHSGSTMNNASSTSQTTTSVVNLARQQQQQQQQYMQRQSSKGSKQTIGPRCHFCGGSHWIYNCPHMDESAEGRMKRREGYAYPDDETSADVTTTTGESSAALNTTSDSTTSSSLGPICGKNQSHPLQCQPCLRHV
eukprot:CAMPEP_0116140400 /NCGR_PEP_ID=MMETSP0329-20121206/13823_1 /TAXON_ID=697910 /ORGANISM="Pseudo-nitzschia arenysensis, Strain B593" /LENGTH=564 /DNA_ID=CAMNT_0003635503 /DNA_START=172 /DNA_END=1863 /DNA_ORIENTATION=-